MDPFLLAGFWDLVSGWLWPFSSPAEPDGGHEFFVERIVGGDCIFGHEKSDICRHCAMSRSEAWIDDGPCLMGPFQMEFRSKDELVQWRETLRQRAKICTGDWLLDQFYRQAWREVKDL